ncbi:hypothetical protein KFE98_07255 [bacterium SCSIO 12741]|nr:hypothetical protein KFE98_07255 [bacterium SCSIO 12741]
MKFIKTILASAGTTTLVVLTFVFAPVSPVQSQSKDLQKLVENPEKLGKYIVVPPGRNEIRNWQIKKGYCSEGDYQIPKKVALLSFYIKDDNYTAFSSGYYFNTSTTTKASAAQVNVLTQILYDQEIAALKKEFEALGIQLLEPHEYLDTEEKKNWYYNASLPIIDEKIKSWGLSGNKSAIPDGYRLLPFNDLFLNGNKFFNEKDDFLDKLGMDAYLTIGINLSAAGGLYKRSSASIDVRNPAQGSKTIYRPFHENVYGNTKFGRQFDGIWITEERDVVNKKGKTKTQTVKVGVDQNISVVTRIVATATGQQLVAWIEDKKKKKK